MRFKLIHFAAVLPVCACALFFSTAGMAWPRKHDPKSDDVSTYDYAKGRGFPNTFSKPFVPPANLTNSPHLEELILNGQLKLSMEDAIALALENNLDIAVARYNLPLAQTDLLRARAGGATRGVAGAYQSSAVYSGAIGGGVSSGSNGGGNSAGGFLGGGIAGIGTTSCCDPLLTFRYYWGHTVTPLDYTFASNGASIETAQTGYMSATFRQSFLTGTGFAINLNGVRQASNLTDEIFNPYLSSGMTIGITQHLLYGFGYRANAVFIRWAHNDLAFSKSVFQKTVETAVANVMSLYCNLLADREDIRVAKESLQYAQRLLADNQTEAQIGAVAKLDVVQSEQDVAARQQDLLTAGNQYAQDQQQVKATISKAFNGELAAVQIVPTDNLPNPHPDDVPPLNEAIKQALQNRPEIEQAQLNLRNQAVTIKAVRNQLLPTLDAFAAYGPTGLTGRLGPALSQVFRDRYPAYSYGVTLSIPIRNRLAQADAARALVEQRQLAMQLRQAQNQAVWDVSKAVSAVHQAKSQLDAAIRVAGLTRESLSMEETKFKVGQAPAGEVITAQTSLATSEDNVVKARATYAKALIQFEQATGTVLQKNNVVLQNAIQGNVPRTPNIPGTPIRRGCTEVRNGR
jgi:outer membrane protein